MNRPSKFYAIAMLLLFGGVLSGCAKNSDRTDAENLAKGISRTMAPTTGATDKACKLFSRDEVSAALGARVGDGHNWSPGGCEWTAGDQNVHATVARPQDWEGGGDAVPGVGKEAFVQPWLGDFRASAVTDSNSVYVLAPSRGVAVQLLRLAVTRLPLQ